MKQKNTTGILVHGSCSFMPLFVSVFSCSLTKRTINGLNEKNEVYVMIERRGQIVQLINERGAVSFTQLKIAFPDVSDMTLRNDLKALDEQRLIVRVHGGAKSVERIIGTDDVLNKRFCRNVEKKRIIAQKAVKLLLPGTSVFLDSGSTITEMTRIFPDQPHIVFTTGLTCAIELGRNSKNLQVYMLGGTVNTLSLSVYGASCCERIREMNYDIAFIGVTGYMKETGFTCGSSEESSIKKAIMEKAETVVAVMDSTKVGISNTFTFASVQNFDVVVSDDELPSETVDYFRNNNIRVI